MLVFANLPLLGISFELVNTPPQIGSAHFATPRWDDINNRRLYGIYNASFIIPAGQLGDLCLAVFDSDNEWCKVRITAPSYDSGLLVMSLGYRTDTDAYLYFTHWQIPNVMNTVFTFDFEAKDVTGLFAYATYSATTGGPSGYFKINNGEVLSGTMYVKDSVVFDFYATREQDTITSVFLVVARQGSVKEWVYLTKQTADHWTATYTLPAVAAYNVTGTYVANGLPFYGFAVTLSNGSPPVSLIRMVVSAVGVIFMAMGLLIRRPRS